MLRERELVELFPNQVIRIYLVEIPLVRPVFFSKERVTIPDLKFILNGEQNFWVDGSIWPVLRTVASLRRGGWEQTMITMVNRSDEDMGYGITAFLRSNPFGVFIPRQWSEISQPDLNIFSESLKKTQLLMEYTVR